MKKECSKCCLCSPVVALWMLRMIVGIIFLLAGVGKIMSIDAFAGMVAGFGYPEVMVTPLSWFIAFAELIGGIALLAGKWIPRCTSKMLIALLFIVMAGVLYHVDIQTIMNGGSPMGILMNLQLIIAIFVLFTVCPKCPFGLSGCKTMDGGCPVPPAAPKKKK